MDFTGFTEKQEKIKLEICKFWGNFKLELCLKNLGPMDKEISRKVRPIENFHGLLVIR